MEIEDAFMQEAIENAGTDLDSDDEVEVREMIRRVAASQDPPEQLQRVHENIGVLAFIAGKTYENQFVGNAGIVSPNHALKCGMAIGVLLRYGIDAAPGIDEEGNYTDELTFRFEDIEFKMRVLP